MWTWQQIKEFFKTVPSGKPVDFTAHQEIDKTGIQTVKSNQSVMPQCGIDLIKSFEGCKLKAYRDQKGVLTIGYGHTAGVKECDVCTQSEADAWLNIDLAWAWQDVLNHVKVPLLSNQYGALLSFTFNCGESELIKSDVLKYVNSKRIELVPQAFKEVCKIKVGDEYKVLPGLLKRRVAEANLFTGSDWRRN